MQKLGVYFGGASAFLLHNSMQKNFYQMSWGVIVNKCVKFQQSYLNLQLKITLKICQPKIRQNLKFCNLKVKFSRKNYQRFSYIFLHLLAVLLRAKYEKKSKISQENFEGEGVKEKHLPLLSPFMGLGHRSRRSGQSGHGLTTFSATFFFTFFAF